MKKKFFFLPLLAALALTGCSNDDDFILDEGGNGEGNGTGNGSAPYGYVAVNIAQADNSRSRAFEDGSDAENQAKSGLFFIFNNAGERVGSAQDIALTPDTEDHDEANIEKIYKAVLVIDGETYNTENPKPTTDDQLSIVCILNAPDETEAEGVTLLRNCTKLNDLKAKLADYCSNYQTEGKFIMTNSVYVDNNKTIIGALVKADNIKTSADAAKANPVNIYVERVVAKAAATVDTDFPTEKEVTTTINGTETTLKIVPTGIEFANVAMSSYLFKNIESYSNWSDNFSDNWWNDATNFRSYWGNIPSDWTYKNYNNKSYNDIINTPFATLSQYIQPNTNMGLQSTNTGSTRDTYNKYLKTAVLVTAQLKYKEGDEQPAHIVHIKGGYFKYDDAMTLIADAATTGGFYKAAKDATTLDGTTVTPLAGNNFELTQESNSTLHIKDYESVAKLNDDFATNYKLVKKGTDGKYKEPTDEEQEQFTTILHSKTNIASEYKDGKCYYYVYIDHTPVANEKKAAGETNYAAGTFEGVVRNHVYKLSLTDIGGLGTPVCDPTIPIIPERAEYDELSFLAAQVKVLPWKIVSQNVTLH